MPLHAAHDRVGDAAPIAVDRVGIEAGATVVWRDPSIDIALWLEPTGD